MVGAEPAQLALAVAGLVVELVDQTHAGVDRALPRLRRPEPGEQQAAADTEEIGNGAGLAVRQQHGVHALVQARAVTHQVQPPACSLPFGAHTRIGEPDRRHEVAAGELGQHPGVDPVGLARQRRDPPRSLRVRDPHVPPRQLELIVHEPGTVHRLDRRADRFAVTREPPTQAR